MQAECLAVSWAAGVDFNPYKFPVIWANQLIKPDCMKTLQALAAGLAGAVALTVTHQLLHKSFDDAPRMDLMGEEALLKVSEKTGVDIPAENLYGITMAGDIAGNSIFYALTALAGSKNATAVGLLLGLAAGIGGVYLPKHLGLTNAYSNRTLQTKLMTIAIYTLGGLVSGKLVRNFSRQQEQV
jgi:hypothetical protein